MENGSILTIHNMAGGALAELFQEELEKVLKNIQDVTTDAEAVRKIVCTVSFRPDEDRSRVVSEVTVKSSLAPLKTVKALMYIGSDGGKLFAAEFDPKQMKLPISSEPRSLEVVTFPGGKKNAE